MAPLAEPIRGIAVRSPTSQANCAPTFGAAELDLEVAAGPAPVSEYAGAPLPPEGQSFLAALTTGALGELAAHGCTARVIVRAISFHPLDSSDAVFTRLGAQAVRDALSAVGRVADDAR